VPAAAAGLGLFPMPLYSAEALVLRTYTLGESDRIVVFLTRDRGKKRGVAKGARASRRRFGGALEPLTRVRVEYFEKETRELVSLNFADPLASPLAATDPQALGYVGYFAELIDAWAQENDTQEPLFRLGSAALDAMAAGAPAIHLARYFEYWVLRLQGVYPSVSACADCGRAFAGAGAALDREHLRFVCRECGGGASAATLSPAALTFLREAARRSPVALGEVALGPGAARELERVHRHLITAHLDREPRSSKVLRDMGA
jgi:DNA repair protein RecO (recombination protein O)